MDGGDRDAGEHGDDPDGGEPAGEPAEPGGLGQSLDRLSLAQAGMVT